MEKVSTRAQERVLLYDARCRLCSGAVGFLRRRDRFGRIRQALLDGEFARDLLGRHPDLACEDSVVLVERKGDSERVFVRSEAVLRSLSVLGGAWRLANVARLIPRSVRDRLYAAIARRRRRWFGAGDTCTRAGPPESGLSG